MIKLTSDMHFANLIETKPFPKECLTFIQNYMQQLRNAHDDLTPIQHDETAFSCLIGTYYPEYIERYTFDEEFALYKIYVILDNECSMTFFTLQGIHKVSIRQKQNNGSLQTPINPNRLSKGASLKYLCN